MLSAALWTALPLAAHADNCPRGTNPCPSQHAQPAPPPPAARAPTPPQPVVRAPAPPPQPTVRAAVPAATPQVPQPASPAQAQGQRGYPQPPPGATRYPLQPGVQQYQQAQHPAGAQPYQQPSRAPGLQQYQQAQHAEQPPLKPPPEVQRPPQQLSQQSQQRPSEHALPSPQTSQVHAPPPAPPRPVHEALPRHDDAPAVAQHRVQLSPSTALITHPGHAGFTAVDRESAHSSIIVEQHADRRGRAEVSAYHQTTSADGHTTTRLYADGRRSVETPTYQSTGRVGGPQFVRYRSGLRAAYLPNGHPLYAERFTKVSAPGVGYGRPTTIVERTIYATSAGGRFTLLSQPIQRYYTVMPIGGYDTFVYRPRAFDPDFFPLFYAPLAAAIVIGPQCVVCPPPVVAFAAPPAQYSDPIELLGDMQVADAVADQGVAPVDAPADAGNASNSDGATSPPPDGSPTVDPEPPPVAPAQVVDSADSSAANTAELATLRTHADALRKQAAERAAREPAAVEPAGAPGPASLPPAATNPPEATLQQVSFQAPVDDAKLNILPVPEDVREQIHKQVRLGVAQHANEHPLALTEVMQSGYSRIFLFQVAGPLDTASVVTGDACALGSGDLIALATTTDTQNHSTAQMKVVAARPGHCLLQDTIDVSVSDLQDMLNTFNERLEGNMRRLQTCLNAKDGCVRT